MKQICSIGTAMSLTKGRAHRLQTYISRMLGKIHHQRKLTIACLWRYTKIILNTFPSTSVRGGFGISPGQRRDAVGRASAILRLGFDSKPNSTRTAPEAESKPTRRVPEGLSNKSRSGAEETVFRSEITSLASHKDDYRMSLAPHKDDYRMSLASHKDDYRMSLAPHKDDYRMSLASHKDDYRMSLAPHRDDYRMSLAPHKDDYRMSLAPHKDDYTMSLSIDCLCTGLSLQQASDDYRTSLAAVHLKGAERLLSRFKRGFSLSLCGGDRAKYFFRLLLDFNRNSRISPRVSVMKSIQNRPMGAHPKDKSKLGRYFAKIVDISLNISEPFHFVAFRRSVLNGFSNNFLTRYRSRSISYKSLFDHLVHSTYSPPLIATIKKAIAYSLLLIAFTAFHMFTYAQEQSGNQRVATGHVQQPRTVLRGEVRSAVDGRPIEGASISVDKKYASTDKQGRFTISVDKPTGVLTLKHIGYKEQRVAYENTSTVLKIALQTSETQIEEVEVVSTGYQKIPKERATGSFEFIDSALFNRKVSTDILSRLEDVVPGLSFNKMNDNRGDVPNFNIRGVGSINSNIWPLIVIDGTAYENRNGDYGLATFNNISPDEIESITVLKDAAALSIWGAQSANGVLVITTKRGKFNSKGSLSFNSSLTVKEKPNLAYFPQMNTSDYIDAQQFLFDKGRYPNNRFTGYQYNPQPILWQMYKHKRGTITIDQLNEELDKLRHIDMRDDFENYIYRKAIDQQYSIQYKVGGEQVNNFTSISLSKNRNHEVSSSYNRLNLKSAVQAKPVKNLLVDMGISYVQSKAVDAYDLIGYNRLGNGIANYPYMRLVDDMGNPVKLDIVQRNPVFRDTIAGGRLLNWDYVPLNELDASLQTQILRETMLNFDAKYSFDFGLKIGGFYSYMRTNNPIQFSRTLGSYLLRNQVNNMASWDSEKVTWNYPLGSSLFINNWNTNNQQGRITAEYNRSWQDNHEINMMAGVEIRQLVRNLTTAQYLGFDPETGTSMPVQYGLRIRQFNGIGSFGTIRDLNRYEDFVDRYQSYFANGSYTYGARYIVSGSFRKDASNLFGVKSNRRGQPFWSAGLAWIVSKENWMDHDKIDLLKFRATYGYNGNVNNNVTAYPIMAIQPTVDLETGENYAIIGSPPNPSLRWERVGVLNLGIDYSMFNNRLSGSIEYYRKNPKDLIASAPVDPSTGYGSLVVNSANLLTKGWDIRLDAIPIRTEHFSWTSNIVFSYMRTKVTKSYVQDKASGNFITGFNAVRMTPIEGADLFSLFTYKWAGLDPNTGDPQGYVNGEVSKDYISIVSSSVDDLENKGSLVPLYYGSFRNAFRYRSVEISCNISYQLGHKFLRNTFNNDYFINQGVGHTDYALRWQKPGDEQTTDVPAFKYPNNVFASQFYMSSSALVESGSQIKLRDIQLSWSLPDFRAINLKNIRLYAYLNNIGVIWRANKRGIDTEVGGGFPDPFTTSIGLNFNL